ncbi:MAG TPA: hypothetical protein VN829_10765 [Dongiaceae bacterium]|nr:hypothetical protein [Dongiaceae bacterium]
MKTSQYSFLPALAADLAARVPALAEDSALNRATFIENTLLAALNGQERPVPRRLYCFINGILTFPGDARNWTGRAVTWTNVHEGFDVDPLRVRAEKVEYWAGPIDRVFGQKGRAEKLLHTLLQYCGWEIVLAGHSNGADVIVDMLRDFPQCLPIHHLHLVCGATEGDFQQNGLNGALLQNRVGDVTVYCAGKDRALALAHTLPGKVLGYGVIGLTGALNVLPSVQSRVRRVDWPDYGHSDCWADGNFNSTMEGFL